MGRMKDVATFFDPRDARETGGFAVEPSGRDADLTVRVDLASVDASGQWAQFGITVLGVGRVVCVPASCVEGEVRGFIGRAATFRAVRPEDSGDGEGWWYAAWARMA